MSVYMRCCMVGGAAAVKMSRFQNVSRLQSELLTRRGLVTTTHLYTQATATLSPSKNNKEITSSKDKEKKNNDREKNKNKNQTTEPWSGAGSPIRPLYRAPPRASSISSPEMRALLLSLLALVQVVFCLNLAHMIWAAKRRARADVLTPLIAEIGPVIVSSEHNQAIDQDEDKDKDKDKDKDNTLIRSPFDSQQIPRDGTISQQLEDLLYPLVILTTSVVCGFLLLWIPSRTATKVEFHIPSQKVRIHHPGIKRLFPSPTEYKVGDIFTRQLIAQHPSMKNSGLAPIALGSRPVLLYVRGQRLPRTLDPTGEFNVKKFNELFYDADESDGK